MICNDGPKDGDLLRDDDADVVVLVVVAAAVDVSRKCFGKVNSSFLTLRDSSSWVDARHGGVPFKK